MPSDTVAFATAIRLSSSHCLFSVGACGVYGGGGEGPSVLVEGYLIQSVNQGASQVRGGGGEGGAK